MALSLAISLAVPVLAAPHAGQIIIDPQNPQWLKRNGGDPVFICGPGDPEDFLYRGTRNPNGTRGGTQADQVTLINRLINNGGNSIYFCAVRSFGGDANDNTQAPFITPGDPTSGLDNDILNQWETWFDLMDANGILIYFFFYDDSAIIWDTGNSVGTAEEAFFEALVNRFKKYKNLIWVVGEEANEKYSDIRIRALADVIAAADEFDHIIGNHHTPSIAFPQYVAGGSLNHYSMQYNTQLLDNGPVTDVHEAAVQARAAAEALNNGYMVIYSENTTDRGTDDVNTTEHIWATAMGGVQVTRLGLFASSTPDASLQACGILQDFFEDTDFNTMRNQDNLKSQDTDFVLANANNSYILYGYKRGVNDDAPDVLGVTGAEAGNYDLLWVDCDDGARVSQTITTTTTGLALNRPTGIGTHCAVHAKRTGGGTNPGVINLSSATSSVTEGTASLTVTVTRSGGTSGAASVVASTANGTALAGSDYTSRSQTLNWASGASGNLTLSIPILNDTVAENSENFRVNLTNASGATLGTVTQQTVTITDNDQANVVPVASSQSYSTTAGTQVYVQLSYTDADNGPGPYTVSIVSNPSSGTLTGTGNDRFYTPNAGFTGTDSFTWRVNDGAGNSNTATATINVSSAGQGIVNGNFSAAFNVTTSGTTQALSGLGWYVASSTRWTRVNNKASMTTATGAPALTQVISGTSLTGNKTFSFDCVRNDTGTAGVSLQVAVWGINGSSFTKSQWNNSAPTLGTGVVGSVTQLLSTLVLQTATETPFDFTINCGTGYDYILVMFYGLGYGTGDVITVDNVAIGSGSSGGALSATLEVDPWTVYDGVIVRIANNSDSSRITSATISVVGGGGFDTLGNGTSYTVSPSPGTNNDGIRQPTVTLTFSGTGLAPGASDTSGAVGNYNVGDIDGTLTSLSASVTFNDGTTISLAPMPNIGEPATEDGDARLFRAVLE